MSFVPYNTERFIVLRIGRLIFKDSYQMLPDSLDSLTDQLPKSEFNEVKKFLEMNVDDIRQIYAYKESNYPNNLGHEIDIEDRGGGDDDDDDDGGDGDDDDDGDGSDDDDNESNSEGHLAGSLSRPP